MKTIENCTTRPIALHTVCAVFNRLATMEREGYHDGQTFYVAETVWGLLTSMGVVIDLQDVETLLHYYGAMLDGSFHEMTAEHLSDSLAVWSVEMIRGQDIREDVTAHELAKLLLAGPDLQVRIPDSHNRSEEMIDDPDSFVAIGRVTHNSKSVDISGYYIASSQAHGHSQNVAPDYQHAVDEPATA